MDFSGGKTGYRAKHQQGKAEQVVKAAALPKRRAAASTSAAAAATKEDRQAFVYSRSPASSPHRTSDKDIDENGELAAPSPLLWDLTAGLGTDSFLLAQAGWRVEMFERSPVVAALVQVRFVCFGILSKVRSIAWVRGVYHKRRDMPSGLHSHTNAFVALLAQILCVR